MSLVNDALNKIQKQRGQKLTMDELSRYGESPQPATERKSGLPPAFWVGINAAVLVAVLVGYHFFTTRSATATAANSQPLSNESLPQPAPSSRPATIGATPRPKTTANPAAVNSTIGLRENTASSSSSPVTPAPLSNSSSSFSDSTPAAATTPSSDSDYDLAGMTAVGKNTLLSIIRRSDQRSFWVPIGKTVGEVTAVSYNADADNAVIQVRGQLITIGMRNGSVYFNPVSPQK